MPTSHRLPDRYAITPDVRPGRRDDGQKLLAALARLCAGGRRLVLLRAPSLSRSDYLDLARRAAMVARRYRSRLMVHDCLQAASGLRVAGVHLSGRCARKFARRPVARKVWLAVSCHTPDEVRHAERLGADFCVFGPVFATASHPGRKPLGAARLASVAASSNIPVYALGGMRAGRADAALCRRVGAQGVAGIRCFWPAK